MDRPDRDLNPLPFRPNVCILLINKEKKLFMGERYQCPGAFQFPQGGVESGLSLEENVLKEIREEVGVRSVRILKRLDTVHQYDFHVTPEYAKGVYRGQDQTFWVVEFLGDESEIDLSEVEPSLGHPEFSSYQWVSIEDVEQVAEPRRLSGYRPALAELLRILPSLDTYCTKK